MPLVIMCGLPATGKSKRADELKNYIESIHTERKVHILSDKGDKNEAYADSNKEKELRASLKSSVTHLLNNKDVVIVDSLNYIKGYRYELYCISKAIHTTQCLIFCDISAEKASSQNQSRAEELQYKSGVFDGLVQRFEEPQSVNRWDSPLFIVQVDDLLPVEDICAALFERKPPPPNRSTQSLPLSPTNFLYELDKITQESVSAIMTEQKTCLPGDSIKVPGAMEKLQVTRPLTLPELQRHRRQFIAYTKSHPVTEQGKIANMFVQYLNNCIT